MKYLGDFIEDQAVSFLWNTFDAAGESVTRTTDGTIKVYKADGVSSEEGVVDTEDFVDPGVHQCVITTTNVFYAANLDYYVVLEGTVIDGQTVNAVIAHFSIENRNTPSGGGRYN